MASTNRSKIARHAGALLVALAGSARAGDAEIRTPSKGGIDIDWDAPADCPNAGAIRAATERLLGEALDAPRSQRIAAKGRVRRNASGHWEIVFSLSSNGSVAEETFAASQCSALADAVALKIALAADPLAFVDGKRAKQAPPASVPVNADQPAELHPVETRAAVRLGVRAAGGAGFGLLPHVSPGGALFGALVLPSFRIELGAQVFAGSELVYVDIPSVGATFDLWTGTARGCASLVARPLELPACAGFEAGAIGAKGFGTDAAYHPYRTWAALVAGPAMRLPLGSNLSLWLEVDAVVVLLRPSFRIRDFNDLYEAPAAGIRGWAGFEIALP